MKSETAETERNKPESRQSVHRRKMSKNSAIVNGAGESVNNYAAEDQSMVRQTNLAAAFHDQVSCTKPTEVCKIEGSREAKVSVNSTENDHVSANASAPKNKSAAMSYRKKLLNRTFANMTWENKKMRNLLVIQWELIRQLENDLVIKNALLKKCSPSDLEALKAQVDRKDRLAALRTRLKLGEESKGNNISSPARNAEIEANSNVSASTVTSTTAETTTFATPVASPTSSEQSSTLSSVNLATRYFGRRSKTIPSRALKRRYLGPPKTIPAKKATTSVNALSATSISSETEIPEDEMVVKIEPKESKATRAKTSVIDIKKISKRKSKKPKGVSRKMANFLTTDKPYYLPDNQPDQVPRTCSESEIEVPSWRLKPVTSFYQMEGTENINDSVFEKRHIKCELEERRRKKWDIQRLREQRNCEKLKNKYCRDTESEPEINVQQKCHTFYLNPRHIQYIEFTEQLPVLAFGHLIPLFQPSEFSLPWKCGERNQVVSTATPLPTVKATKKGRPPSNAHKVT